MSGAFQDVLGSSLHTSNPCEGDNGIDSKRREVLRKRVNKKSLPGRGEELFVV